MKRTILCGFVLMFLFMPQLISADILQLSPCNFIINDPDEADVYYMANDYIYAESGSSFRQFYAALPDLPHLGTIDQMRVYYNDNDDGYVRVRLWRRKVSDNSTDMLVEWQSTGSSSFQRTEDIETFTYPTIKSKGYRYYIGVWFSSGSAGSNLNLCGIRFRYYPPSS